MFEVDLESFFTEIAEPITIQLPLGTVVNEYGLEVTSYKTIDTNAYASKSNGVNNYNINTNSYIQTGGYEFYILSEIYNNDRLLFENGCFIIYRGKTYNCVANPLEGINSTRIVLEGNYIGGI